MEPLRRWFVLPVFEDEEKNRAAGLLNTILWVMLGLLSLTGLGFYLSDPGNLTRVGVIIAGLGILIISYGALRFGYVNIASYLLVGGIWAIMSVYVLRFGGLRVPAFATNIALIIMAGLLLGQRGVIVFTVLALVTGVAAVFVELNGLLAISFADFVPAPTAAFVSNAFTLLISGTLLYLTISNLNNALKRAQDNESALRESNLTLENVRTTLEERVVARTERLEIIAALSERLNAILDLDQLLQELVDQVKERFHYYHVHIYLLDEAGQNLMMRAGVGQAGAQMKAQGHQIPLTAPTSLVARSARSGEVVSIDNVRQTADWLPNPLLADTYSEMAVPIILEGQVVGVLDVQEDEVAGLDESDATVLRSLASQVAVAIRNARLFAQVEAALANAETAQKRYITQAWEAGQINAQSRSRQYTRPGLPEPDEASWQQAKRVASGQENPVALPVNDNRIEGSAIVAPISIGDQKIGAFQLIRTKAEGEGVDWQEQDLAFVSAILDQIAQTAENLRLFQETQERAGRERTIREITDKLRSAPNLDLLLETAARELGQRLGVQHTVLELGVEAGMPQPVSMPESIDNGNG